MTINFKQFILYFVSILYSISTFAIDYNYTTLIFLDYSNLKPIVMNAIKESRSFNYPEDGDRVIGPLKKALKLLLSRPDSDNLISKLSPDLISDLKSLGVFHQTIDELIEEGKTVMNDSSLDKKVRTTSLVMLNNLLLTIRPMALKDTELAKDICQIADKEVKVPKEVLANTELTTMVQEPSPTKLAQKIMLWYAKKKGVEIKVSSTKGCPFSKKSKSV